MNMICAQGIFFDLWPFRPFTYVFMTTLLYRCCARYKKINAFPLLQLRLKRHPLHLELCNGAENYRRFYWSPCTDVLNVNQRFIKKFSFLFLPHSFFDKWFVWSIFHDWKAGETDLNLGCSFKSVSTCFTFCLKINKVVSDRRRGNVCVTAIN